MLESIKGIGGKTVHVLAEYGITTIHDLIHYYPRRYESFYLSTLQEADGQTAQWFKAMVKESPKLYSVRPKLTRITVKIVIENTEFTVAFFNQNYLMRILLKGTNIAVKAKIDPKISAINGLQIKLFENFKTGIMPIYNIEGISDHKFLQFVQSGLRLEGHKAEENIPGDIRIKYKLIDRKALLKQVHQPQNMDSLNAVYRRLKYEELWLYQLHVQWLKYQRTHDQGHPKAYQIELVRDFVKTLPYELTEAQKLATNTIFKDLKSHHVMQRLVQGDTGSGKTIVAFLALLATMSAGYQVAFLAPTEILAEQHFNTLQSWLSKTPYQIELLTGSMQLNEKQTVIDKLKNHSIDGIVGTHALFSHATQYAKLGLVITDEQHRFGVNQREKLKHKGQSPDVLYLSATPIPRTLSMTLFGDMDLTIIDEKPIGRKPTKTMLMPINEARQLNTRIKETISKSQQVYVIAPRIDDSDADLVGIETLNAYYQKTFPNLRIASLHGRQKAVEKDMILRQFKQHKIDILIATTVIEVGIHVDNATLMIIFHAERFGYAQIHQLRGRVGRSALQGHCVLLYRGDDTVKKRLALLETIDDGFKLSEEDLKQRGFGDVLGTLQSGYSTFQYSHEYEDLKILKLARDDAADFVQSKINKRFTTFNDLLKSIRITNRSST